MEPEPRAALARGERLAWLGPLATLGLALFAYRPLFAVWLHVPTRRDLEGWFFRPTELPALLVLGVAAWLLWRGWQRLAALPARSNLAAAVAAAAGLAALGGGLFVWAMLTRASDLLFASLAAQLLALASATRGLAGAGALLPAALALLLGLRIPAPLLHEIVWQLQRWTAGGAAALLELFGQSVVHSGAMIYRDGHAFHVIEACSGLRGVLILTLVGLVVRDLFAHAGARSWLLLLVAPPLGFLANLVRIAVVAAGSDPETFAATAGADHTPQGLSVLMGGTALLYALGWGLARAVRPPARRAAAEPGPRGPWGYAAAWLGGLAILSLTLPSFAHAAFWASAPLPPMEIPAARAGWRSEPLTPDPQFLGPLPESSFLFRRYQRTGRGARPPQVVELFVAYEWAEIPIATRLLSSRMAWLGPDWSVHTHRHERLWRLGRDAELAVLSREQGTEHAASYVWHLNDRGLMGESLHALLALQSSPHRREDLRGVVRLATPVLGEGPAARERAKRVLDRFIADFQEPLAAL